MTDLTTLRRTVCALAALAVAGTGTATAETEAFAALGGVKAEAF